MSALSPGQYYGIHDTGLDMGMHSGYVRSSRGASLGPPRHDRARSETPAAAAAAPGLGAAATSSTLISKAIRSRTSSDSGHNSDVLSKLELYRPSSNGASSSYSTRRTGYKSSSGTTSTSHETSSSMRFSSYRS